MDISKDSPLYKHQLNDFEISILQIRKKSYVSMSSALTKNISYSFFLRVYYQFMNLSRQIGPNSNARDFANLQRYQHRQPSIYNQFFAINLIDVVEKLPPLNPRSDMTDPNLIQTRTQPRQGEIVGEIQIQHKVSAYHHEIDRLNQDIQINQYVLSNVLLGRGAHSTVRLAKSQDRFYAVKIIWFEKIKKKYFLKQKQLVKMINAEINLLLKLTHPNIILLKQAVYSQQKERIFIVLEYCARGSLSNIYNSRLDVDEAEWQEEVKGYFIQIVEGLAFIHQNGVIHRDIKPDNVLVNQKGELKIIDFNISEVLQNQAGTVKITNKFIGTKGYAAPELIIGTEQEKWSLGKALDIWSLGITLLELLNRKHPFTVKTVEQLLKYLSQDIQINPSYSAELQDLLKQMLRRKSEQRIGIKQIKKHPWMRRRKAHY